MRFVTLTLGLVLAVGLSAAPSVVSVASAQDAEPAAQKDVTFDEALLDIPEGESGSFYSERAEAIGKAFGGKDHSTVKYSVDLISQKVREDKGTRDEIDIVIAAIHDR